MPDIRNLIDKNKLILYSLIIVIAFLVFSLIQQEPHVSIKPLNDSGMTEVARLASENRELRDRLAKVEPVSPVKIVAPEGPTESADNLPVLAVMAAGSRVPFDVVFEDGTWVRPAYQPYWHSKQGHWSNIPDRIQSSYHRLFVAPWSEGLWNETIHEVGIAELNDKMKLPVYDGEPANTITVIAIRQKVTDMITLNNQVVLLGTPTRTGLQVISLNRQDLLNSVSGELPANNDSQNYLFQMATPDGFEIDYCNAIVNY